MAGYEDNTLDAETLALFANAPKRFVKKLRQDGECVLWTTGKDKDGYGQFWLNGSNSKRAHHLAYAWYYGPYEGGVIMHSCDNPSCVNPKHLSHGTALENRRDCVQKNRHAFGVKNGASKLTENLVREMREKAKNGVSQRALGREYGVDQKTVWCAIHKVNWSFL